MVRAIGPVNRGQGERVIMATEKKTKKKEQGSKGEGCPVVPEARFLRLRALEPQARAVAAFLATVSTRSGDGALVRL